MSIHRSFTALLVAGCVGLSGCSMQAILDMLSTDTVLDVSCAGDDTVVVDGRDLCKEFEATGKIECDVGYRIRLDGQTVCP
jgi:hypothetical protein